MDFKNIYFTFCLILVYLNRGVYGNLSPEIVRACTKIFDPSVLLTSCCQQIDAFAKANKQCANEGGSSNLSNCDEIRCVTRVYNISTNGEVVKTKVMAELKMLDKIDKETKAMNKLITKYCLQRDYTAFPAKDNSCNLWKFLNCAFFSYNIGCQKMRSTGECTEINRNVHICRPYADQYVSLIGTYKYLFDQYNTCHCDSS